MLGIPKDYAVLIKEASKSLEELDISLFAVHKGSAFKQVNGYIALKAVEENRNIYLGLSSQQSVSNVTLPILLPISLYYLVRQKNTELPPLNVLAKSHVFFRDSVCYEYVEQDGQPALMSSIKNGVRKTPIRNPNWLDSHLVIERRFYSDRKCHKNLMDYIDYYQCVNGSNPPSFHRKKILVVGTKINIKNGFKDTGFINYIPMAELVSKKSELAYKGLPLDPLIVLASDYEAARQYMISHIDCNEFVYVMVVGENRISSLRSQVKNDYSNGLFKQYCLIGSQTIKKDNSLLLWHWESKEEALLRGKVGAKINYINIDNKGELDSISSTFYDILNESMEEFGSLELVERAKQALYRILSDKINRNYAVNESLSTFPSDSEKILLSEGYDADDIHSYISTLHETLCSINRAKIDCMSVWEWLSVNIDRPITLVLPKTFISDWIEACPVPLMGKIDFISFKEFYKRIDQRMHEISFYFPYRLNKKRLAKINAILSELPFEVNMLLYGPEIKVMKYFETLLKKIESQNRGPKDDSLFPYLNLDIPYESQAIDPISKFDSMEFDSEAFNSLSSDERTGYDTLTIEVETEDGTTETCTCPHKVIKVDGDLRSLALATELEPKDEVLIYENKERDYLYQILSSESAMFKTVESYSHLWKDRLRKLIDYRRDDQGRELLDTIRLRNFALNIGVNSDYILKNWLNERSSVRFPQKSKLIRLVEYLESEEYLTKEESDKIYENRRRFMGVMISLGHNLSAETQLILLSQNIDLYEQIQENVIDNDSEYPILSKLDIESVKSIIKHNYTQKKFVRVVVEGEEDEDD